MVLPPPRTTGFTIWYSSISPSSANCETRLPLPKITMSAPGASFIFRISAGRSPFASFVLFHDALSSVLENTTFRRLFIRSATTVSFFIA
jgi:hypothetical protein